MLGVLLVAGTAEGVAAVRLGDGLEGVVAEVARELGEARPEPRAGEGVAGWADALAAYVDGRGAWPDVPVALRDTAFRARVWEALRRVPAGEVVTYGELARELGVARGARAVGSACAANPVALAVPCHRVVPAGGGLGGYRWGLARKAELVWRERGEARSG